METVKRKPLGAAKHTVVLTAVLFAVWAIFALVVLALPLSGLLIFFAFQLIAVALPGLALVKLLRLRLSPFESLTAAYALGLTALLLLGGGVFWIVR